jgi:pyrroloquinoline-quinone synthase
MSPQDALNQLDQLIKSRSILGHPFYVAWQCGELTPEQLGVYAQVYYLHVAAFTGYLQAAIDSSQDEAVRAELTSNLEDELHNPKAHSELWLDFAQGLGLSRDRVLSASPHPAAEAMVSTFKSLASTDSGAALAALYAYESQQPEVSKEKASGLHQFYGIDDPQALAYFEVHAEADLEHRRGERAALLRCLENGTAPEQVLDSAAQALDAYWGLLDGICESANIPLN